MSKANRDSNPGRVINPRTLRPMAMVSVVAFVGLAAACGGKVDFVTGGTGGEAGGRTAGNANLTTSMSAGLVACLPEADGDGPFGPPTIKGSKCFDKDDLPPNKPCPETVVAGSYIPVDSCYLLADVDDQCQAENADECCYNITEELYCK